MSLDHYKKQLVREAKKNPKQAAALGTLLVVALWFWAPLVSGWIPGRSGKDKEQTVSVSKEAKPTPPFAKQNIGSDAQGPETKAAKAAKTPRIEWSKLTEWIEGDALMSSAQLPASSRDPFLAHLERSLAKEEEEAEEAEKAEPVRARITPKSIGLTLSSTIVGSKRRVAMIGGRAYREGKTISVKVGENRIKFFLAEVGSRHVVLIRDEKRYELTIQSTSLAGTSGVEGPFGKGE